MSATLIEILKIAILRLLKEGMAPLLLTRFWLWNSIEIDMEVRKMKGLRVYVLLLLAIIMALGCASGFAARSSKVVLTKTQVLNYNLTTEPKVLDPAQATGLPEFRVLYACFEGLTAFGPKDVPVPAAAAKWKISPDGKTYTFSLRKNAKWSNGDPVTAGDFEYAWKRLLNPKTGASYANNLYYLKNGEEYNTGKITDASQVGVKAKGNYTLVVTLKAPCSYFLALTVNPSLYPVNRKVVEAAGDKWASNPKTLIGNGPFRLANWVHQERLEFVPNSKYWNKAKVKLNKLVCYTIEEQSTGLTMFETDKIDLLDELPTQEIPRLEAEKLIKYSPYIGTYYYLINVKKAPFNDARVRKALALAIDRGQIVKYVTKSGEKPSLGFVPYGVPDAAPGSDFREVGGNYHKDGDINKAKQLLAEAGYADISKFPTIQILYNTSETQKQIAEVIQEMWKKQLGINATLTNQEWKAYLVSRKQGDFQIARASWIGDYVDPMTFMDLWVSDNGNNYSRWANSAYDKLIDKAKNTTNAKLRLQTLHQAEKLLMNEMPIIPIYFYTRPYIMKNWVKGVRYSAVGLVDFSGAYITAH
jgi:oligopeptide transport system substrate-binding protein